MATLRPPFLAADLPSLRKKIEEGSFERIPSVYSQDLEAIIRLCLLTSPKERPSAESLLHHSLVRRRFYLFPN
jgi:serine/threonine protein kinase